MGDELIKEFFSDPLLLIKVMCESIFDGFSNMIDRPLHTLSLKFSSFKVVILIIHIFVLRVLRNGTKIIGNVNSLRLKKFLEIGCIIIVYK